MSERDPNKKRSAFVDTSRLPIKEPRKGWRGRFFHSENMTFGYYTVAVGSSIHEHSHENEEAWNVIEGELEVTIAGRTQIVRAGDAAVVPPDTLHAVKAITDARAIVVDQPRRASIGDVDI